MNIVKTNVCSKHYFSRRDYIFRLTIFLVTYFITALSLTNCILYLNYRTLGYSWVAVTKFIMQTGAFYISVIGLIILFIIVYDLIPLRSPSS
jgi:hypothetical protein